MSSIVVITEKPSMARAIREGLGSKASQYEITNAFGHILEQAEPDAYLPDNIPKTAKGNKKWRMEDLPIIPKRWLKYPKKDAKEQLAKIGQLLKGASLVINAGDPDREGQLLIDEILEYHGYRGKTQRVWLKALDPENVRKAFADLRDNREYLPLMKSAEARSESDWMVGMNLTRAITLQSGDLYVVGRVQTPTLALVVRRDLEIENFVARDYFEVIAQLRHAGGGFQARWVPSSTDGPGFDEEGRLIDRRIADAVAEKVRGTGRVTRFEAKEQKQSATLPFSLSALQKAASAKFGMSANRVLEIAQSLYEKKITSYPRTDCRYLPEEQWKDAGKIMQSLPIPPEIAAMVDTRRKHPAWNNAKITAHNAIIPTGETPSGLTSEEAKIFDLIWRSYVALFLPEYRYRALSASVELGGENWKASGRQDIDPGWKRLYGGGAPGEEEEESGPPLPAMKAGDPVQGEQGLVQAKQTKPPARFTDGSLIEAMSNIYKFVTEPEARAKLKETSGIGTEATRAATIEALFERGYLTRKGKQVLSTEKGRKLVAFLDRPHEQGGLPELLDPVTTARWEDRLSGIADGSIPKEKFVQAIEAYVRNAVEVIGKGTGIAGGKKEETQTAPCPICGGDAVVRRLASKNRKGVYFWSCSNREAHPLLADDNGKPGKPFGSEGQQSYPEGPDCPHCSGTKTQVRRTDSGRPYFRCPNCKAAFWPDRENSDAIGSEWPKQGSTGSKAAGRSSGGGRSGAKRGAGSGAKKTSRK